MDKELEQQAITTFVQQPEVYAEFLNNNGQDGSQIPVDEIKQNPNTYVDAFQKDKKFHDTVVGLFQAIVKSQNKGSMFKNGGKFDYLKKLQYGGDIVDPTYRTVINAPGDTLRTKFYKYRTDEMQTYPNGNVRYTTRDNSGDNYSWGPNSKPNFIQRLWFGNQTASPETINNWNQLIENHKNDRVMDKTKQLQEGGRLKRRDMFNQANANRGFTRQQARLAYNNARRAGLSREAAMRAVIGNTPTKLESVDLSQINNTPLIIDTDFATLDNIGLEPIEVIDTFEAPAIPRRSTSIPHAKNVAPSERIASTPKNKSSKGKTSGGLVAVMPARTVSPDGLGLSSDNSRTFKAPVVDNTVRHQLPESERAAHEAYLASLEPRTVQSYGQSWAPATNPLIKDTRPGTILLKEPEKMIYTPLGWVDATKYLPSNKKGGTLAKENEVNKKYIKDSEKAGAKASKEMSDLKAKHKKEISKLKKK